MPDVKIAPPFPYFGSKADAADRIWEALGDPPNFVDAFCGTAAVLYARPSSEHRPPVETVNDLWGFLPNFLRAVRARPKEVAKWADWPVSELDMHARHRWLLRAVDEAFVNRLREDENFYDAKVAGYFAWGSSIWIGSGFCIPGKEAAKEKLPHLQGAGTGEANQNPHYGKGLFRKQLPALPEAAGQLPHLHRNGVASSGRGLFRKTMARGLPKELAADLASDLSEPSRRDVLVAYFRLIARRLERVRIVCGDFRRVLSPAVTFAHGLTGVFLDPVYSPPPVAGKKVKGATLYAEDDGTTSAGARAWARENGENPLLRIVLAGYAGEHDELGAAGWRSVAWKHRGGYGNQDNGQAGAVENDRERLWLSPHCIGGAAWNGPLFAVARAGAAQAAAG